MNTYSLTVSNITGTSADVTITHESGNDPVDEEIVIVSQGSTEIARQTAVMATGDPGDTDTLTFTGLNFFTTYTVSLSSGDGTATPVSFTTLDGSTPKIATTAQWQDLANRVNAAPTITMTTTDPGEGSPLAENNYIAVYGGDPLNLDYSTTEASTGAKWIDGKTIYKKTINFGALPNNERKLVAHGISNLGYVIKAEGMSFASGASAYTPIPSAGASGVEYSINLQIWPVNIEIRTGTNRSSETAYITLYYTKSS